ncbi:class II aldolase/adducin family protein [Kroppenstedtia pulmonis]|uniref:Class II aldolase/adducin family protein n=1 Tax=Kroppenstedtia pulmonis TaxID=1380685 RepID=A0A7D4CWH9_9BACL|nr:class II aldolase/adducin family protein [Kroppenstedtia pulmonis]QKG85037.1 class II aldolase/adducin family protein [Kroppenstedtia pulmonis]
MSSLKELVYYTKQLSETGLVKGTSGNISIRDEDSLWITPSALPYDQLKEEDLVQVSLDEKQVRSGHRKPSSELPMHAAIYRKKEGIQAIVHTHSTYATMFAAAGKEIPPIHYLIADIGDTVPVVPYATYGSDELAVHAVAGLEKANGVLLGNHGVIAVGNHLSEAFRRAETIESLAQMALGARMLGEYKPLSQSQLDEAKEKFASYITS